MKSVKRESNPFLARNNSTPSAPIDENSVEQARLPEMPPPYAPHEAFQNNGESECTRTTSSMSNRGNRRIYRNQRVGNSFQCRLEHRQNSLLAKVCSAELVTSVFLLITGFLCADNTPAFCATHSAIWTAIPFILTAIVGIKAAKSGIVNYYIAHLIFTIIALEFAVIGIVISAFEWNRTNIKFGITITGVEFLLTVILGLLFVISFVLCLRRTCTGCDGNEANGNENNGN